MLLLGPSLSELLPKNKGQTEQEMKSKNMYSGHCFLDPAISEDEALELLNCASPSISPFFCSFLKVFYFLELTNMHGCSTTQLCLTLWDPRDCSPQGSSVLGIFQTRILKWVGISCSRGIFLTKESNPSLLHLLHWQVDSLPLSHVGSQLTDIAIHK